MTNLGEWIAEEREAIGYKKGCEKTMNRIILRMHKYHEPLETIIQITGKSEQEIKEIISKSDATNKCSSGES